MTLDLAALGRHVAEMGRLLANDAKVEQDRLARAVAVLRDADYERLRQRQSEAVFAGLAARPTEPISRRLGPPRQPAEYVVVATDGSLIEPDRHGPAYYYLINVGEITLRYGDHPEARLHSEPTLGYRPEDLYLALDDREVPLHGGVLRIKRAVAETEYLAAGLMRQLEWHLPLVGLQDGTLILWMPEGNEDDRLRDELLRPFLAALDRVKAAGLPIASYISRPRSSEVVNLLRLAVCEFPAVDCRKNCPRRSRLQPAPCDTIDGVTDARLFDSFGLKVGERSSVFASSSRIMKHYRDHQIYFFYLNVGPELSRVEIPEWVARDTSAIGTIHAVVLDQARRGAGYPRALTEAHERAVVGVHEREQCERMIEAALQRHHLHVRPSQKHMSKRLRAV